MPSILTRNIQALIDDDARNPLALAPSHQACLVLVDREVVVLDQSPEIRVQHGSLVHDARQRTGKHALPGRKTDVIGIPRVVTVR